MCAANIQVVMLPSCFDNHWLKSALQFGCELSRAEVERVIEGAQDTGYSPSDRELVFVGDVGGESECLNICCPESHSAACTSRDHDAPHRGS